MPFFSAALVAAPPASARVRVGAVVLVAAGASLVATRAFVPATALPPAGGMTFLAGVILLGWATFAPLRRALGPSRPLVAVAYGAALADVLLGATLATAFVGGWVPILERWSVLKPVHAWLNLLGFVSLVIAGTLLHLLPTVLGTRIATRASAAVAVAGLVLGAPLVALGFAIAGGPGPAASLVAGVGAFAAVVGAVALAWHAVEVVRSRGRWSTDPGWHRLTSWGLVAAVGWFAAAVGLAAGRILVLGACAGRLADRGRRPPLAVGWVLQALVAAWSHLLPSIGPGGPPEHARQRRLLGRASWARLGAVNLGTALLAVGSRPRTARSSSPARRWPPSAGDLTRPGGGRPPPGPPSGRRGEPVGRQAGGGQRSRAWRSWAAKKTSWTSAEPVDAARAPAQDAGSARLSLSTAR